MEHKKLLQRISILIFFIFFLNLLANKFYWYVSIPSFDIFMHTLGGFWLALAVIFVFKIKEFSIANAKKIIIWVLIVGLLWEVFEFGVSEIILKNPLNTKVDTITDLICDTVGGMLGILYVFKNSFKDKFKL